MPALELSEADRQEIVAAVADLVTTGVVPIAHFKELYDRHRSIPQQTPRFAVFDAEAGSELQAVPAALRRALDDDFFVALSGALLERMTRPLSADDPRFTVIKRVIGTVPAVGVMQTMLRVAGVRPVESLPALIRATRATASIAVKVPGTNETKFGTGFLITPTLILTAAHVVDPLIGNGIPHAGAADLVSVVFHNQLESAGVWPIRARLAPDWLVCMSPPNGANGLLALTAADIAAQQLDFALIRLSEPVGHIAGIIDVATPPVPQVHGRLTVIGYPGGSQCVFDDHLVLSHEAEARRIHHDVNTANGMSGGPCIDTDGKAVGLHEGSLTSAVPPFNRAVHLGAVREALTKANGGDPLLSDRGPLWGIHDREARLAWIAAGDEHIGRTDGGRAAWRAGIAHFNPDDPRGGISPDIFHPVFGRTKLQDWIDGALLSDAASRIALISGGPGSGKSFSTTIVRSRLKNTIHRLVVVSSSIATGPIANALASIVNQAGGEQPAAEDPVLRPTAGVVRRDLLPDAFSQLSRIVRTPARPAAQLWVIVDIGEDASLTADAATDWKQFLIEAERQSWVRLLILGLSNVRRGEFSAAAAKKSDVSSSGLSPISVDEFAASIEAQAQALKLQAAHWVQESNRLWDELVEHLSPNDGRSVVAVRAALEIRALMLEEARQQ